MMKHQLLRFSLALVGGAVFGGLIGGLAPQANAATTSVSIALKPQNQQALTDAVYDTVDPTSPNYHHYLSAGEVANQFGRSDSDIAAFKRYFKKYKLQTSVYRGHFYIQVRGSYTNLVKAFKAKRSQHGKTKITTYQLPANLKKQVLAVVGLNAKKTATKRSHKTTTSIKLAAQKPNTDLSGTEFSKKYGATKFTSHYQVDQLYKRGLAGAGQQIGIIASDFKTGDVKRYLTENGISADTSRIHKHYVGPKKDIQGTLTDHSFRPDQVETTLDVEQAASVAPGAQIQTYLFPLNSNAVSGDAGYLNGYAYAIADNKVKQISSSYGYANELVGMDAWASVTPKQYNAAFNALFQQAALQGITLFNASGDHGPYEDTEAGMKPNFTFSTSPFEVQVGGTTLPFQKITSSGQLIKVLTERAWGESYGLSAAELKQGAFAGGAGGFSKLNATPRYQLGVPGVNTFSAIQRLTFKNGKFALNKHPKLIHGTGHGRNIPDVSGNADQDTGYAVYTSLSKTKGKHPHKAQASWLVAGGTSFVAPQMAAANAVMNSGLSTPIGFWNPQIYKFAQEADSPFNVLDSDTNNDNLYYTGQPGKLYNQATGLGTVNFEKLYGKFGGK